MIFARKVSASLTSLVKKIDEATVSNSRSKMGSFVVFLGGDDDDLKKEVKDLADKENIKKTILGTLSTPSGPPKYKLAKDADVTVVLYLNQTVEANFAFASGKLTEQDVAQIVRDLSKILPKDKTK